MNKFKEILKAIGMLITLIKNKPNLIKGNKDEFKPNKNYLDKNSNLKNKRILFLGSSITYGAASKGNSFVEFLNKEYGVNTIKEAQSGTTLAGKQDTSYIERLKSNVSTKNVLDGFVCQLSTNDGRFNKPIGSISESYSIHDFDTETTIGAIEFIIAYVKENWACPVIFYTCIRDTDPYYEFLINELFKIKTKWHIHIIDVWGDKQINKLAKYDKTMMADDAHPTLKGYRYLYTPIFSKKLSTILIENNP
ncbi:MULTISPECIES: SGNH/GDSL hydrolase family protein [unclassified Staphylococcus]|uniref:SGNH/GDSL hydrolase family protein n=1 Tax=unclassified Staphylococcus TaxID=91994 RepID=UPI0008A997C6|nr:MULTISPECIES: SGNH/GDSL hydrolase family protein [unclassified Staphylococcus]OHR52967.1 lysophospholipase [Staphylococcus sp. HMSC070A03]OHR57598.1 lysophospholipase [Staphylococcus sp. HMSC070A02]